jgi:hypothetical protein
MLKYQTNIYIFNECVYTTLRLGQRPIDQATSRKTMTPQVPAVQPLMVPTEEQPMEVEEEVLPQSVAEAKARFEQEEEIPQAKQPKHKKPTKPAQPAEPVYKPVTQPFEMRPTTKVSTYKHVAAPVEAPIPVAHPQYKHVSPPVEAPRPVVPPQEQPKHVAPAAAPVVPPVPSPAMVPKVQSKKKVQISDRTRVKPPSPPGYDVCLIILHAFITTGIPAHNVRIIYLHAFSMIRK